MISFRIGSLTDSDFICQARTTGIIQEDAKNFQRQGTAFGDNSMLSLYKILEQPFQLKQVWQAFYCAMMSASYF
jgi:hypothetical protein